MGPRQSRQVSKGIRVSRRGSAEPKLSNVKKEKVNGKNFQSKEANEILKPTDPDEFLFETYNSKKEIVFFS